ncbi:hypothetical protein CWE04_11695 [Thomasclavelia cocleata]|uniref:Uncharacterized protein n=1 Tax=Thomasclavelia cocleata TaxID=69824 RepID=A0A1I0BK18_9FIRM|nr:hypothetical protein [Thomasclavelia cocleata]MCR1960233.1 hypothetical protein [Thomasclavelia cocleata]NDO41793.1 hypothetical protein [Thomasclavelia cocleata]PJN79865.1 hypothetical protein CWE04_11695 [Thomasclavelia cocleata]SET06582.1 hypothetical protein SAMN04489758_101132 [Thomasclavelia cocleata]
MKTYISDEAVDKFEKDELIDMFKNCDCEYNVEHTIKKYYPGSLFYEMSDMRDAYIFVNEDDIAFSLLEEL